MCGGWPLEADFHPSRGGYMIKSFHLHGNLGTFWMEKSIFTNQTSRFVSTGREARSMWVGLQTRKDDLTTPGTSGKPWIHWIGLFSKIALFNSAAVETKRNTIRSRVNGTLGMEDGGWRMEYGVSGME